MTSLSPKEQQSVEAYRLSHKILSAKDLSERKDSSHYGLYKLSVSAHDEQAYPLRFEQQDAYKVLRLRSASKLHGISIREVSSARRQPPFASCARTPWHRSVIVTTFLHLI
jgi:hypothetical protein